VTKPDTRLGKGLGALLEEYLEEPASAPEREVPVASIRSNPFQPRSRFSSAGLAELTESIRENGLLQPLIVRPAGDGWEIVAGERRWRALKRLEHQSVPVIVRDLSDEQMLVLALVENLQREDLGPLEEAHGYRQLIEQFGLTQGQVGERVGKDRTTVTNALRLLTLPESVQEMVADGALSAGHGRALLGVASPDALVKLARQVVRRGLSVRETEERVRALRDGGKKGSSRRQPKLRRAADPVVRSAEKELERALGTQVAVVTRSKMRGEIRITFHDAEDFDRLLRLLTHGPSARIVRDG
jgi:ParB family chromosome partitioning protein